MKKILGALLLVTLAALPARADWEGKVKVKIPGEEGKAATETGGMIRMRKDRTRIDLTSPMEASVIIDAKTKKAWALLHAARLVTEMDSSQADMKLPACSTSDVEACLKKMGLKQVGEEKVNGQDCAVYEGVIEAKGNRNKFKLWHPKALREVPAVRTWVELEPGRNVETDVTDVVVKAQAAASFEVPKGYQNMGNMSGLLEGFKGF